MNILKYISRSLSYFKKQHISILIGTVLSTAVITGALIVGDSVKYSLQKITVQRLGKVEYALNARDRFVSEKLVVTLDSLKEIKASGLLAVKGMAIESESGNWVPETEILGIDTSFWHFSNGPGYELEDNEVLISSNLAERLDLNIGDDLLLRIENLDAIPVNSPFSEEKDASISFRGKIKQVLDSDRFGRFSLLSNQKAPYNIFVSRSALQKKLDLPGKLNMLLANTEGYDLSANELNKLLDENWTLEDAGLILKSNTIDSIPVISSERVFIDEETESLISASFTIKPIMTYLVNGIIFKSRTTPYSFVYGIDQQNIDRGLGADQIILNDWCATDLGANVGDSIVLEYYIIGPFNNLESRSKSFLVTRIETNQSHFFTSELMPDFPGLADAKSCSDWDSGLPIDLDQIRDKDEAYWNEFKGTPKAIISLETAQKIWGNDYGQLTSIFFPENQNSNLLRTKLNNALSPKDIGMNFMNVREDGNKAVSNAVDFGELFLSMSFFVWIAGLLLLILLYGLHMLRRIKEFQVLDFLGIKKRKIFRLILGESLFTIVLGSFLGALLGIAYNYLLMLGLSSIWQGAVRTKDIHVFIDPLTVLIGFLSGLIISVFTIVFVLNKALKKNLSDHRGTSNFGKRKFKKSGILALALFLLVVLLLSYSIISGQKHNTGIFMASGALLLASAILFINAQLSKIATKKDHDIPGIWDLALKNLARNKSRSLLAISLLALGVFSVLITGANRQTYNGSDNVLNSGTGGFTYWMETSLPILYDPSTKKGKEVYNLEGEAIADSIEFLPLSTLKGEDASCLNLNQVQNPQLLGIDPQKLNQRGSFSFANTLDFVDVEEPWLALNQDLGEGIIPAVIDQTVITWGLMKKVGDTLLYVDDFGEELKILIAGGLNNSIFQGNVLLSRDNLLKHFPSAAGANILLVDASNISSAEVEELLNFSFRDYGLDYTSTVQRMRDFNSVSNTYLTVFMMLGGLGLLIGTIGFGIILIRNRQERKNEFALLSAIGIKDKSLFKIIFFEHCMMLLLGIGAGLSATAIGIIPSLLSESFSIPLSFIGLILLLILLNGIFWIYLSARNSDKAGSFIDLRNE